MDTSKRAWIWLAISGLFVLAIGLRIAAIPAQNVDTNDFARWYRILHRQGLEALSQGFATYTPPYLVLLWLATRARGLLPPLTAIKLIPMLFDALSAIAVYKLVRLRFPRGPVPWLASAGFLLLPTVILNSAYWGQIDSLYASLLLWCLYLFLTRRDLAAMIAFGLSISIKAQAVFLLPFLVVMALKRRLPWALFLVVPLIYALAALLPGLIAGRPLPDTLNIYVAQVQAYPQLAMHAANLYSVIPYRFAPIAYYAGLGVAAVLLGLWTLYYGLGHSELVTHRAILLTALLSLILVPFLLPKMHDRYFYPADILSYVMVFFEPSYVLVAAGYQLISGLVYFIFLRSVTPEQNLLLLRSAVLLNTLMVPALVIHHFLFLKRPVTESRSLESSHESA